MKTKLHLTILGLVALSLTTAFCHSEEKNYGTGRVLGISGNQVGYIKNNVLKFYTHTGNNKWQEIPNKAFVIPKNADEVFMFGRDIGVRVKHRIDTYELEGAGRWVLDQNPEHAFQLLKDYDAVNAVEYYLAARKGNVIEVYLSGAQQLYPDRLVTDARFDIPAGTKEAFWSLEGTVLVSDGKHLSQYVRQENGSWNKRPEINFPLGADCKGIVPLSGGTGFGYLKTNSVDFYALSSTSPKPYYKTTFTF